jgi:hypothetical protein
MSYLMPVRHSTRTYATVLVGLVVSVLLTACGNDSMIAPASTAVVASASHGGGGGSQPPAAPGPFAGTWIGQESWGPGAPFVAAWTVKVTQDSNSTALLGSALAALEPPNFQMNGVVLSTTHVDMNFTSASGKFGLNTISADLTLSADGSTLSGPIVPSPSTTSPATLTLHRQ